MRWRNGDGVCFVETGIGIVEFGVRVGVLFGVLFGVRLLPLPITFALLLLEEECVGVTLAEPLFRCSGVFIIKLFTRGDDLINSSVFGDGVFCNVGACACCCFCWNSSAESTITT